MESFSNQIEGFLMVRKGPTGTEYHLSVGTDTVMIVDRSATSEHYEEKFYNGARIRIAVDSGTPATVLV